MQLLTGGCQLLKVVGPAPHGFSTMDSSQVVGRYSLHLVQYTQLSAPVRRIHRLCSDPCTTQRSLRWTCDTDIFLDVSVTVSDVAPDFVLPGTDGTALQLSSLRGRKVVLFFYPRNNTRGCTAEACAFRDAYEELATAGAEVVGISSDSVESHRRFAASRGLPFPIGGGPSCGLYGELAVLLGMTGPVTYR